ncbi:MAG: aminotransferase class V-fold PLP-dependent enzyme [Bacillati bacterium ANGP1]|uniref:Aminotransferase class V-fold PLP-dependent enzyme n=1 Tax=Candidatus Segetimicrobium genomatis TaxID=2569760 RepID=A0A537JAC2_9BACT|nr:MAG: aminotransferase class V-fold PLP-dependent enzyme [Terrabacteria group bacterium ANGP1]
MTRGRTVATGQRPPSPATLRRLFLLRPDVVFLNHGSFGACPRPVFDVYQRWQLELERQPVEFLHYRFKDLMQEAREALAGFLGVDAGDVVYVTNATTGLNIVARSLALGPGDEILTTDHEYGALDKTWRFICERQGVRYVQARLPLPLESPEQVVDAVWARRTPKTRVLFLSHITSPTALTFPVETLVRRAREAGILTVIDGAHAPGHIPLNLGTLGADFYAGNCHKWMCAPKGSGFLYARREVQSLLAPLVVSWGWPSGFVDEQQRQGTRDIAAFLAVPAAIDFLRRHNWTAVRRACHAVARTARARLLAAGRMEPLSADSPRWYAQMVSVPVPLADAERARTRLWQEFNIEAPITAWNGRCLVRASIQGYNTPADVDALVTAVARLIAEEGR